MGLELTTFTTVPMPVPASGMKSSFKLVDQKKVEAEQQNPAVATANQSSTVVGTKWRYFGQFLAVLHILTISFAAVLIKLLPYHPITCGVWRFQGIFLPYFLILLIQIGCESKSNPSTTSSEKSVEHETNETIASQLYGLRSNRKVTTLLFIRGLCSTVAALLMYNAFKYISIADAIVLTSTEPIFVKLVAYFWLREPCGLIPALFAILSVVGIVIVARPPLVTGAEEFNLDTIIGLSFAFGCLLCSTMIVTIVRYLRTETRLHYAIIIFAPGIIGTLVCLTLAIITGAAIIPETMPHLVFALLLATLSCIEQITITFALKFEAAGPISIIKTTIVIFSFLWEFLFFAKAPDVYSLIGGGIVVFCVVGTVLHKYINEKHEHH